MAPAHEIKILQDTDRVVSASGRAFGRLMQRISSTPGIYQEKMVWRLLGTIEECKNPNQLKHRNAVRLTVTLETNYNPPTSDNTEASQIVTHTPQGHIFLSNPPHRKLNNGQCLHVGGGSRSGRPTALTPDDMPSAVITGANSGIGHAFAKVLIDAVSLRDNLDHLTLWSVNWG